MLLLPNAVPMSVFQMSDMLLYAKTLKTSQFGPHLVYRFLMVSRSLGQKPRLAGSMVFTEYVKVSFFCF